MQEGLQKVEICARAAARRAAKSRNLCKGCCKKGCSSNEETLAKVGTLV